NAIKDHDHHIIQVTPRGVYKKKDSSLVHLWNVANDRVVNKDTKVSIPTSAAKLLKYSSRLAGTRDVDIQEVMGFVRADVKYGFKRMLKLRKDITQGDILTLIDKTLNSVREAYEPSKGRESVMIFEMVLKALEKLADEEMNKSRLKTQSRQSPSPS
ncbi:MAG: hypothetical protein AAF182_02270, partial [Pseudomonadota bacterium]